MQVCKGWTLYMGTFVLKVPHVKLDWQWSTSHWE